MSIYLSVPPSGEGVRVTTCLQHLRIVAYWKVHSGTRKLHSSSVVLPNNTESPSLSRPVEWGIKMLQIPTPSSWRESTFLTGLLVEEAVLPG